jgi:hypothetical protein
MLRAVLTRAFAAALLSLGASAFAAGPVFDVNSFADVLDATIDGVCNTTFDNANPVCTLRAAAMEANLGPNPSGEEVTINLQAGVYLFTRAIGAPDDVSNGDLNLTGKVRITGKGLDLSTIDANHLDRVLNVGSGALVKLVDLGVQGGRPPNSQIRSGQGHGGGILNRGGLTLLRCLVRDNRIVSGHAGAGIGSFAGSLTVVESMIRVNHPTIPGENVNGGGIFAASPVLVSRSTVYSNSGNKGGGIYQEAGTLAIVNSTISGNGASSTGAGLFLGAGASATIYNTTIATNSAGISGGGIDLDSSSVALSNSILFNTNSSTFDDLSCSVSSVTSNGYNIIRAPAGCAVAGAYGTSAPSIVALAGNGGLTVTHALLAGQGVDTGNTTGCTDQFGAPLLVDQRGVKRPIGARCDLGAFEKEPIGDVNGDGAVSVLDVFYLINSLFASGPVPVGRANVNGDQLVSVLDVFHLINYLFANGPAPA